VVGGGRRVVVVALYLYNQRGKEEEEDEGGGSHPRQHVHSTNKQKKKKKTIKKKREKDGDKYPQQHLSFLLLNFPPYTNTLPPCSKKLFYPVLPVDKSLPSYYHDHNHYTRKWREGGGITTREEADVLGGGEGEERKGKGNNSNRW